MRRSLLLVGGLLVLAACGGGGGGGPAAGPRYEGTYHAVYLYGGSAVTQHTTCETGAATTTSATTTYFGPVLVNDNGILSTADPIGYPDHATSAGPDLSWSYYGFTALAGGISPNGELAGLGTSQDYSTTSGALFLVRASAGRSTAQMAGDHHVMVLTYAAATHQVVLGTATLDGLGDGTFTALESNTDGSVSGASPQVAIGVTVSADGSIDHTGGIALEGGMRADGAMAVLGGGTTNGSDRRICVYLRKATAATTTTLVGSYTVVGLGYRPGADLFEGVRGTMLCDGAGTATQSITYDAEGVPASVTPAATTYSVGTDGNLNVRIDDRNVRGAVSADGSVAVLGTVVTPGTPPAMYLLIRR